MQHQLRAVGLLHLAVDGQPEVYVVRVLDARLGDELGDGHEGVEALGDGPGEALFLGFVLDVAGSHVDGDGVCFIFVTLLASFSLSIYIYVSHPPIYDTAHRC